VRFVLEKIELTFEGSSARLIIEAVLIPKTIVPAMFSGISSSQPSILERWICTDCGANHQNSGIL